MAGEVRYCTTSDGVRIGYSVQGKGPPLVLLSPPFTAFSLVEEIPAFQHLQRKLGDGRSLIRLDFRGIGLSQRDLDGFSSSAYVLDILAVVDALGLEHISLLGPGPVGGTALLFAAAYPARVSALVIFGGRSRVADRGWQSSLAAMMRNSWETAARTLPGGNLRHSLDDANKLVSIYLRSTSGEVAADVMDFDFDIRSELPNISARTLIIHSQADPMHSFSDAQEIAARIPNARLMPLQGNYSFISLGDKNDEIAGAINGFLDAAEETRAIQHSRAEAPSAGLRTVLFTDLVGHTEMMSRLGDERGRAVLREHERITREVLKAHGGTEVKTMGDGFMASFGSVTKAVECAVALQNAFAEHEGEALSVRVGLNAGEPIEEDGDLFGATVILAARIAAKADGGEILASDVVRGLCSGKGFGFTDRGEFAAKGFEEPVRVFEISWR
jgi:class 3 adenylate cyclase